MPRRKSRKRRSRRKRGGGSGCSLDGAGKYRMRGGGIWDTLTAAANKVTKAGEKVTAAAGTAAADVGSAGSMVADGVKGSAAAAGKQASDTAAVAAGNPTSGELREKERADRAEAELRALKSGSVAQPMREEEVVNTPMVSTGPLGHEADIIAANPTRPQLGGRRRRHRRTKRKSKRRRSRRKSKRRRRRRTKRRR